ncbi:hypothetical protein LCGC14_1940920 [marine sediment metagenome]|uniref:HNH nuclease domain-containing protein n=1 Tax=marine sediment metagenome TaxID=412755 RepID=A0A0F9IHM0_9ZZZZ
MGRPKGRVPWNKGQTQFTDERIKKWSGENHFNWKGGKAFVTRIRRCSRYTEWVKAIFKRDNYTCQMCPKRGGNLQADHYPKMFCDIVSDNNISSYKEALNCQELWNINNGRTLCVPCHKKTFKFKGNQFIQVN